MPKKKSRKSPPASATKAKVPASRSTKSTGVTARSAAVPPQSSVTGQDRSPPSTAGAPATEEFPVTASMMVGEIQPPPLPSMAAARFHSVRGLPVAPSVAPPSPDNGETEQMLQELVAVARAQGDRRFSARSDVGTGGVGVVTSVFDHVLKRRFAWKTLLDAARARPMLVRSFLREAQITAALEHPNIVPVHDLGLDASGRLFFTMKLVQGRTLSRVIQDFASDPDGRLKAVLDALFHVCDALSYAHIRGVIHCDIKPENVMVGDFGQVYLMDWGFAVVRSLKPAAAGSVDPIQPLPAAALSGVLFGTPAYMAPEQAHAHFDQIDERTDVFALGALLYHALTGRPPYQGKSMMATVLKAQEGAYPRLDADDQPWPRELVRIIHRAMAPSPDERYGSVAELRSDLDHFVRGGATFPTRQVAAGEHILREGDAATAAYIITSGAVEVYKTVDGKRVVLGRLGPGDTFGEMALLAPAPRAASAIALEDTLLITVTSATIEQEMNTMKPWMGVFVRTLTRRFRDFQEAAVQSGKANSRRWWQIW